MHRDRQYRELLLRKHTGVSSRTHDLKWPAVVPIPKGLIICLSAARQLRCGMRTKQRPGLWSGRYPPGSPAEWLADGHVTCSIHCLMGDCKHVVDVRLDTFPCDQPWSIVGRRLVCGKCGTPGTVNIVPNWHDRIARPPSGKGDVSADDRLRKTVVKEDNVPPTSN